MVTGRGLAGALQAAVPPMELSLVVSIALLIANTINIGADLSGMADAAETAIGPRFALLRRPLRSRYRLGDDPPAVLPDRRRAQVADARPLCVCCDGVLRRAGLGNVSCTTPSRPPSRARKEAWEALVAILGTTISPYLFFWQASQEVEEEKAMGRQDAAHPDRRHRPGRSGTGGSMSAWGPSFPTSSSSSSCSRPR